MRERGDGEQEDRDQGIGTGDQGIGNGGQKEMDVIESLSAYGMACLPMAENEAIQYWIATLRSR